MKINPEFRKLLISNSSQHDNISDVKKFQLLAKMPFDSDRKRMSVIVKDPDDDQYKLYCKGADSIVNARVDKLKDYHGCPKNLANNFLDRASRKGYRTLVFAMRVLTTKQYEDFRTKMAKAEEKIDETLDERRAKIYSDIEQDLLRIGATAIEDRLQENVAGTISALR